MVFGDVTHVAPMSKILTKEIGISISCAGTYCKHDTKWFKELQDFFYEILIIDDRIKIGNMSACVEPSAIFGIQMERHIGKRLDIPYGVISLFSFRISTLPRL